MGCRINRSMLDLGARRVLAKVIVAVPILRWSDWPGNKTAAAVWADVSQDDIDTRRAKRAFVSANARFKGIGWQRFVAVLACRSEFKHGVFS
jgi:hypothetical protein